MPLQYIILDGKSPTHQFKDGEGAKSYEEVKDFDNVAVIVPEGYQVLDFDTASDAKIMLKIIEGLDLNTRVMNTTRGIHCWFKIPAEEECKNFIKSRLACGIICDRKAGGRNAYVKIKQDGVGRKWIRKMPLKDLDVLPHFLRPVSAPSDKFNFKHMSEGSGRNQELFNYIVYLQTKGFDHDEIRQTIHIINDHVFTDPLPESEIATICRDEAFKSDEEIEKQTSKKGGFSHIDIATEIMEKHHLINYNGVIYEYLNGYYQPAEFLRRYVRETYFGAKNNQVREVVSYIKDMQKIKTGSIKPDQYILNLKNTRLDIRTGKCLKFTPEAYEFNQIPVIYDPSAYNADLDKMLHRVFLDNKEVLQLFEEMMGSILIKNARYQKAFLFYGFGSNGKSTILNLIKTFLGKDNISTISLKNVSGRFNTVELEHKLANIGDDVENQTLRDTGTLKKLFAGNSLTVERKGEQPYTIEPYATHIYSCNAIPRSYDKTDGFYRRWAIIPFHAVFSPDDPDYDAAIEDKIMTQEALSYLLNISIRGAKRLMKRGKFIEPKSVLETIEMYKIDNSTVLSWIDDKQFTEDHFLDHPCDELYSEFSDWCVTSGISQKMKPGKKKFYKEIIQKFDFEEKTKQRRPSMKRYFVVKID